MSEKNLIQEDNSEVNIDQSTEEETGDQTISEEKIIRISPNKIVSGNFINKIFGFVNSMLKFFYGSAYSSLQELSDGLHLKVRNMLILDSDSAGSCLLAPAVHDSFTLGLPLKAFKDIYASGNVIIGGKNAVKSGVNSNATYTVNVNTSITDGHYHTVTIPFYTTSIIKDGVEYQVFEHT